MFQNKRVQLILGATTGIVLAMIALGVYVYFTTDRQQGETVTERAEEVLFPFGSGDGTEPTDDTQIDSPTSTATGNQGDETGEESVAPFRQIATDPTAGIVIREGVSTNATSSSRNKEVRYITKRTGNVFRAYTQERTHDRLSNTTIPRVQEALWSPDGRHFIARFLDESNSYIRTFAGELTEGGSLEYQVEGTFLPRDITSIDISPSGNQIFYIEDIRDGSRGVIADISGDNPREVLNSPLREWRVEWATASEILLTTKPSAGVKGYAYSLNPDTGAQTKVIDGVKGLVATMSPDGDHILYSESSQNQTKLFLYNRNSRTREQMQITTLADKCGWASDGEDIYCGVPANLTQELPDEWYKGLHSFRDSLFRINTSGGFVEEIIDPTEALDMTDIIVSDDGDYVGFIDRKSDTVWGAYLPRLRGEGSF